MRAEVDFSELSSHRTVRAGLNERRLRPASPLRTPLRQLPRRERLIEPYLTRTGGFRGGVGAVKGMGGHVMVLVGLLGRPGAGACQNLPQRRPAAVSAANETAEYQRFFSRAPARSGPLWQIWTIRAAAGPRKGCHGLVDDPDGHPGERTGPTGRDAGLPGRPPAPKCALRTRKCSSNRHSREQNAPLDEEGASRSRHEPRRRPHGPRRPRPPGHRFW